MNANDTGRGAADAPRNAVHRLRISLVSGPWADGEECVRYVDFPERSCLYDLHEAIQEAVGFDDEHPFHFFSAEADGTGREGVPPQVGAHPDRATVDCDVYEDVPAVQSIPDSGIRGLFYAYLSEGGDWIFRVERTGESGPPIPGAPYPLQVESLSSGPNPTQYGHDFDDYAEEEDAFDPPRRDAAAAGRDPGEDLLFDEDEDDPFGDREGDGGDDGGDDWPM